MKKSGISFAAITATLAIAALFALVDTDAKAQTTESRRILLQEFGESFVLSLGGKLYDNLWVGTDLAAPGIRHPNYPENLAASNAETWRCVSCHGWDYKGARSSRGTRAKNNVFKSLRSVAGIDPGIIKAKIRAPGHLYAKDRLPDLTLNMLAAFLSRGQYDRSIYLDEAGNARGDWKKGQAIYQGACINCHQENGRAYFPGERGAKPSLGWLARNRPAQALHKIRNGVPGAYMLALRFLEDRQIANLLAYLQRLDPTEK